MILRKVLAGIVLFFSISPVFAQIVDDSTKVIYGTNTTKVFTQDFLYREKRTFFNKDTMYIRQPQRVNVNFNLVNYKRPALYTKEEEAAIRMNKIKADSIAKANELPTYFKKGSDSASKAAYKAYLKNEKHKKDSVNRKNPWIMMRMWHFRNNYNYTKPDTNTADFHNYNFTYIKNNIYQNLGIIGTPNKPVFYLQPEELGYSSGFNSYDIYFTEPAKLSYYDTKSPYTRIEYMNTTGGEDRIKGDFNLNITRNWNVGISYQRINANKQINLTSQQNKGLSTSQDFKLYTSFKSQNERYHFMGSFNYFVHRVNEQGGLKPTKPSTDGLSTDTLPVNGIGTNIGSWPVWLNADKSDLAPWLIDGDIFSRDRRVAYHFYQQYDILPSGKLSVFHEFDRRNQQFRYQDPKLAANSTSVDGNNFYHPLNENTTKTWRHDSTNTRFNQEFAYTTNKVGLKTHNDKYTAIGYYKSRNIFSSSELSTIQFGDIFTSPISTFQTFFVNDPKSTINLTEHYAGGEFIYRFKEDSVYLHLKAEAMFHLGNNSASDSLKQYFTYKGDHNLSAYFKYYNLEAGFNRILSAPSMLQMYSMDHNNFYWWNSFAGTQSNRAYLNFKINTKHHNISFTPSFTLISRYTYYDTLSIARQLSAGQDIKMTTLELDYRAYFGILHFDAYARYTHKTDDVPDVIRFPEVYANPKIYLSIVPKKRIGRQQFLVGLDFHFRSSYYGDAYMPAISQFHLQNTFLLKNYLLTDFFVTAKIRNATISARINQINQMLTLSQGYYITPYYPGTAPSFVINVRWMLFD